MQTRPKDYAKTDQFLWTDLPDAAVTVKAASDKVSSDLPLVQWIEEGYVIPPKAVDKSDILVFDQKFHSVLENGSEKLPISFWDEQGHHYDKANVDNIKRREAKVLDLHTRMREVQNLIFAPNIMEFLTTIFRDEVVAFQCLYFEYGSQQGAHQDTAFVYTDPVYHFAASWIALEDIRPGTGELFYYPGSHRLDDLIFSKSASKALFPGDPDGRGYSKALEALADEKSLKRQKLLANASDVLIWSADLIHGGEPLMRQRTRKSIVTHYCPRRALVPYMKEGKGQLTQIDPQAWVVGQY